MSEAKRKSDLVSPFGGTELCQIPDRLAEPRDARGSDLMPRTNTFDGIRARMIKHLSQDVSSRRQSRVSIGHSDEEVARRAEVRRLRQKRIQDELQRDNEGHAPSVGSNHSTQRLATVVDLGSPRSGPRDTIEFSVVDCAVPSCPDSDLSSSQCSRACAASCIPNTQDRDICYSVKCSLQPEIPSATDGVSSHTNPKTPPLPEQKRSSALTTSIRPSSQLDSSQVERVPAVDSEFNIRHGSHAWDDQTALGVWLIAQGIKLHDTSMPQDEQTIRVDRSPVQHASSTVDDFGGVDSIMEFLFSVPEGALAATPLRSDDAKHGNLESDCAIVERYGEKLASCPRSDEQAIEGVKDKGSSNYPSVMPSVDSSPSLSEARSYVLSQQDMENLELSPIRWYSRVPPYKDLGHSEGKSSYTTADEQVLSNNADDSDVPEILGAFISHSEGSKRQSKKRRSAREQVAAPDLNKPLPAPGFLGSLGDVPHVPPSSSEATNFDTSSGTSKRISLKQKLQKSLSGLSKLGDHTRMDKTMPEVPSSRESQKPIMSSYV
ncbi:hypothetical protein E4U57_000905 [Claviceps arundinis]|uniref:Uncharacterized protein n=1 Tax=Claviceps arundinis TaxID=1623583 RepID=A0ABQ7PLB4_9HYPO|nr:hypothetical protein E4U57_000905 [Claviceps arundinis]